MASGITTANPPDLAIKALWIAPHGSRAHNNPIFSSYVHRTLAHQQRIAMSPCENDTPINWKRNLIVTLARLFSLPVPPSSLVMPFPTPSTLSSLGYRSSALNMWSVLSSALHFYFRPSPHRFGVDSPTVKAENSCYYALPSAWAS